MFEVNFKLDVFVCIDLGKGVSCCLCCEDKFFGIIYGGEEVLVFIILDYNKVNNFVDFEVFYFYVFEINFDGKVVEVLVKDM